MKEIRKRVKARLELCAEIRQLESGELPTFSSMTDPVPNKVATSLYKFTISSWKNYCTIFKDTDLSRQELINSSDVFYEAILRRGNSKCHILLLENAIF